MPTNKRNFTIHYFVGGEKFYLPHELLMNNCTFAFTPAYHLLPFSFATQFTLPRLYVPIIIIITSYFLYFWSAATVKGEQRRGEEEWRVQRIALVVQPKPRTEERFTKCLFVLLCRGMELSFVGTERKRRSDSMVKEEKTIQDVSLRFDILFNQFFSMELIFAFLSEEIVILRLVIRVLHPFELLIHLSALLFIVFSLFFCRTTGGISLANWHKFAVSLSTCVWWSSS